VRQTQYSIMLAVDLKRNTVHKILSRFFDLITQTDFSNNKLCGPGVLVDVDETKFNYRIKSKKGRPPSNRTDSLCILEFVNNITRAYACLYQIKHQRYLFRLYTNNLLVIQ
jgi:hypothetical protein